jgi:tetratricopeptide (TPR) repeat protein
MLARAASVVLFSVLSACASGPSSTRGVPIDQVPMYGGMDRNAYPQLKAADEKLIHDTTAHYGSRAAASAAFADQGFRYYKSDDLTAAMRRFNQAWLLDPENADAYWGFASVLNDRRRYCEATALMETALSKPNLQPAALPDAGVLFIGCARTLPPSESARKQSLIRLSEDTFRKAIAQGASKEYTLFQWARAKAGLADYAGAWAKVREFREATGKNPPEDFLKRLGQQMPEPSR